ncbi:MAG: preprotein translocase subunit SecA [Acidobacteriota bacterium]
MSSLSAVATQYAGVYPQAADLDEGKLARLTAPATGVIARTLRSRQSRFEPIVDMVEEEGRALRTQSDETLRATARALRAELRSRRADDSTWARSFALTRELSDRLLGLRHFDVQVIGGWIMLEGMVAEMQTGEGKTLTANLPAAAVALSGSPVHVVSVNDYLVKRDAEMLAPVYAALGLSVGVIQEDMQPVDRRAAYACDITYVSNKQITFDYLRDRLAMGRHLNELRLRLERLHAPAPRLSELVLRGLHFAIIDEIDSVLVDEARTPLIISRDVGADDDIEVYEQALELAGGLEEDVDFELLRYQRTVEMTDQGLETLEERAVPLGGVWSSALYREELCTQALSALHLFHRDTHYLVVDDKVQIVDEFTGRIMADRSWQRGLHQMLEVKEGASLTGEKETLARISYQKFFRRYLRLAGMTGTAREIRGELWSIYGLPVARVPTNKPDQKTAYPARVFATKADKYAAILERVRQLNATGRPVLVGTRSVATSEDLSRIFTEAGLEHQVLNARQNKEEAEVVSRAGELGRITVATNMAGRGTDIVLEPGVAELGGLHVIATEFHQARRIDRQLFGRCGRQGDPGSYETMASLEDDLAVEMGPRVADLMRSVWRDESAIHTRIGSAMMRNWQRTIEARHARTRRQLVRLDEQLGKALAFTGQPE